MDSSNPDILLVWFRHWYPLQIRRLATRRRFLDQYHPQSNQVMFLNNTITNCDSVPANSEKSKTKLVKIQSRKHETLCRTFRTSPKTQFYSPWKKKKHTAGRYWSSYVSRPFRNNFVIPAQFTMTFTLISQNDEKTVEKYQSLQRRKSRYIYAPSVKNVSAQG